MGSILFPDFQKMWIFFYLIFGHESSFLAQIHQKVDWGVTQINIKESQCHYRPLITKNNHQRLC